ncbi:3'-5' exonuclease [Vibrio sp. 10N.261.55.A7]|uniref:3'-5' exonuclease n=1 Tax=Vibrio sp. 10N.261.55.A7 TaxID=1880851 RepID=UPI000C867455|nr:3'-5' exonuclease [Vibrio sp. 10N.261.55.A7]PMJ97619.1 DNA polymerase III subunit epsilon [Vibrio sp. 10N.261.55.A7]
MIPTSAKSIIILDFETTGLSPNMGDRAIEIGAVKVADGEVIDSFQQLMNPGFRVSSFIESYTGITNNMLAGAPSNEQVMSEFSEFIQDSHLVAHNASFDQRFLDAELDLIDRDYSGQFVCSLLVARRLIQDAPSHKLGELVKFRQIENDGVFHRALADSEVTAKLWLSMVNDVESRINSDVSFDFMKKISKTKKTAVEALLNKEAL